MEGSKIQYQKAKLKRDISIKMKSGDLVEIIPTDAAILNEKVGDYISLNEDEVIIKKANTNQIQSIIDLKICKKQYLEYL